MSIVVELDIPDVEPVEVTEDEQGNYIITVESLVYGTNCRCCGQFIEHLHGYDNAIYLRHLPVFGRQVRIELQPARYWCKACQATTTQRLSWYRSRSYCTRPLEEYIVRQLSNSSVQDVANKNELSWEVVNNILKYYVATQVNWDEFAEIQQIGIDEIAAKKGRGNYQVIISANTPQGVRILAILTSRKKEDVKKFLLTIPAQLRATVQDVCTDMYEGYINAAKEVFGAEVNIIIDRFHIAKNYRAAADKARRAAVKELKKTDQGRR